jgi:hypothetical protein
MKKHFLEVMATTQCSGHILLPTVRRCKRRIKSDKEPAYCRQHTAQAGVAELAIPCSALDSDDDPVVDLSTMDDDLSLALSSLAIGPRHTCQGYFRSGVSCPRVIPQEAQYCPQHAKQQAVHVDTGISHATHIPSFLSEPVKALLLTELHKETSAKDEPGYLYVYKCVDDERQVYKIGRSNHVFRRLTQWKRQCGNKLVLLHVFPSITTTCRNSHKLERLVHTSLHTQRYKMDCDCGTTHVEWFQLTEAFPLNQVVQTIQLWVDYCNNVL